MTGGWPIQGSLITEDFLRDSVATSPVRTLVSNAQLNDLQIRLRDIFARYPTAGPPNQSHTEEDLVRPVMVSLGWTASLCQQNLSARGDMEYGIKDQQLDLFAGRAFCHRFWTN